MTAVPAPYLPTAVEVAVGWVGGFVPTPLPRAVGSDPRQTLEDAVLPGLLRSPCHVTFSGGRDSSAVLALAVHVARQEGLPDPVPWTDVYPGVEGTEEERWQQLVLDHLGLRERVRVEVGDGDDLVGPVAEAVLDRYGVVWPALAHGATRVLSASAGGAVLTGEGGDELLGTKRVTVPHNVWRRRGRLDRAAWTTAAADVMPAVLRRRRAAREYTGSRRPWLRPPAYDAWRSEAVRDEVSQPLDWRAATWAVGNARAVVEGLRTYAALAAEHDVLLAHPLLDDAVRAAVAHDGGRVGYLSRTAGLRRLVGDLLPDEVLRRSGKATFNRAYFHDAARAFAREWDGDGLDPALVDPSALREEWLGDEPDGSTALLLQQAWLAVRRRQVVT